MSLLVGGYQAARSCTGSATPGARAMMSWFLGAYGQATPTAGINSGIYVCKAIAGTATTSLHGEGRAFDWGARPWRRPEWGWTLAGALVARSRELGVQCVIFDGHVWSSAHPHDGWRRYLGRDQHTEHLHGELTWTAARTLTAATIGRVMATPATLPFPTPGGGSAPAVDWTERLIMALPTLRKPAHPKHDENVQTMQNLLQARGHYTELGRAGADGEFGPGTEKALRAFQRERGLTVDGVCGRITWHHLLQQQRLL